MTNPHGEIDIVGPSINLNRMVRRGSVGRISIKRPDGAWTVIGIIRGPRHSRGWRKHLRRMKEARK